MLLPLTIMTASCMTRTVCFASIAPNAIDAILAGEAPHLLNADRLRNTGAISANWDLQPVELLRT